VAVRVKLKHFRRLLGARIWLLGEVRKYAISLRVREAGLFGLLGWRAVM